MKKVLPSSKFLILQRFFLKISILYVIFNMCGVRERRCTKNTSYGVDSQLFQTLPLFPLYTRKESSPQISRRERDCSPA